MNLENGYVGNRRTRARAIRKSDLHDNVKQHTRPAYRWRPWRFDGRYGFGVAARACIQPSILRHKRTSQFHIADSFERTISQIPSGGSLEASAPLRAHSGGDMISSGLEVLWEKSTLAA